MKRTPNPRRVLRTAIAASAVAMATAGVAVLVGVAGASTPQITSPQTVKLNIHGGSATFVNASGKKGFAIGDEIILQQPVFAAANPSKAIGHGYVTITFVSKKNVSQLHATLILKAGDIDLGGVETGNPFTLPITGGTGLYQNARGEATVKTGPGKGNPATVTLNLLP